MKKKPFVLIVVVLSFLYFFAISTQKERIFFFFNNEKLEFSIENRIQCYDINERNSLCEYKKICTRKNEIFEFFLPAQPNIIVEDEIPLANLMASEKGTDQMWRPKVYDTSENVFPIRNEILVIATGYSQNHYTHFLYNLILPSFQMYLKIQKGIELENKVRHALGLPPVKKQKVSLYLANCDESNMASPFGFNGTEYSTKGTTNSFIGFDTVYFKESPSLNGVCFPSAVAGLNNSCYLGTCLSRVDIETAVNLRHNAWQSCGVNNITPSKGTILIIQRTTTRRIQNLPELIQLIDSFLLENGKDMEIIVKEFENLDFCEQVSFFAKANCVISAHGNVLGNIIWMKEKTHVIELNPPGWESPYFKSISKFTNNTEFLQYYCHSDHCKLKGEEDLDGKARSMIVDFDIFFPLLKAAFHF